MQMDVGEPCEKVESEQRRGKMRYEHKRVSRLLQRIERRTLLEDVNQTSMHFGATY